VESKVEDILETGATVESAYGELEGFVTLWDASGGAGIALANHYRSDRDWPVNPRGKDETPSRWLRDTLRDVSQWGEYQLAWMSKLRPSELPTSPIDATPALTPPILQLAFDIELRIAALRAKAVGPLSALQTISELCEQAKMDGFLVNRDPAGQIAQLLSECVFDPGFLSALKQCSVILGSETINVCHATLARQFQTTPLYLQTPRFDTQNEESPGYQLLSRAVVPGDVPVGYALRVWAKQANWHDELCQSPSNLFGHAHESSAHLDGGS
jgi:hypothetical protein